MATVTPTIRKVGAHTVVFAWTLTNTDADGAPVHERYADYADRCVQIAGTFNGATVVLEGSNDGSNYITLKDQFGSAITVTSAGLRQVSDAPLFVRPNSSGGGGSQAVVVTMMARRSRGGKEI